MFPWLFENCLLSPSGRKARRMFTQPRNHYLANTQNQYPFSLTQIFQKRKIGKGETGEAGKGEPRAREHEIRAVYEGGREGRGPPPSMTHILMPPSCVIRDQALMTSPKSIIL